MCYSTEFNQIYQSDFAMIDYLDCLDLDVCVEMLREIIDQLLGSRRIEGGIHLYMLRYMNIV